MGLSEFSLPVYSMVNFRALPTSSTISSCFIFTELYEENHVRAEQTALRILKNQHDAEDAVQNAFMQIIRHFEKIDESPGASGAGGDDGALGAVGPRSGGAAVLPPQISGPCGAVGAGLSAGPAAGLLVYPHGELV